MTAIPFGDYEGETHWQNGAGAACGQVDASASVSAGKIELTWKGSAAGTVTLAPMSSAGWWEGKLRSGEKMEFEAFYRDEVIVLWGKWGNVGKPLDLGWYARLEKTS